jgi:hypothetical protein
MIHQKDKRNLSIKKKTQTTSILCNILKDKKNSKVATRNIHGKLITGNHHFQMPGVDPASSGKAARDYLALAANIATSISQTMDPKNLNRFAEAMRCAGLNGQFESGAPGFSANKSICATMEANKNTMLEQ